MRVVIQGEKGSFHHQAVKAWFTSDIPTVVPAETFTQAFLTLETGKADMALVAVENSIHGSLNETLDLIESYSFPIVGEIYLRIHQQLIGLSGAAIDAIRFVYSQPVALAQCNAYLATHLPAARPVDYHDTTASVIYVKKQQDPTIAAIAGKDAADEYGLTILASDIEDNHANFTRFLLINPKGAPISGANKTSLVVTTTHAPGALAHVLSIFAKDGVNLSKLQSRPIVGDAWNYRFYIDVDVAGKKLSTILAKVRQTGATVTVLGEYRAGQTY